ncbi:MAG: histidine triad nucleotide-binding protein [Oscillospiraceae bacterium]|nr:histidine triad nucleotide-binding protein [Oscillospiraceae bacterium]
MDCVFCKIISGEIPSNKVYEDSDILAFRDISPVAPTHILVIPKRHIASAAEITHSDGELIGKIFAKIADIARAEGVGNGFRVVSNCGETAGQTVFHLHFHIIGGRELSRSLG